MHFLAVQAGTDRPFVRFAAMTAAVFGASGGIGAALAQALVARGHETVWAGAREAPHAATGAVRPFSFDLTDEGSIRDAAVLMAAAPPDIVIIATGVLTPSDGTGPEKSLRQISAAAMAQVFQVNTIGPALVARHMLPLLPRDRRAVFAALSARVGSIGDNRLGGWHSYRASKAALNMLLKNFAIELARSHPLAVVAGLHPGTVATGLSDPFQRNVPEAKLFTPEFSANVLLTVLDGLGPQDSGGVFDWQGARIEP